VFQVTGNHLKSLPPELGLLTNLKSLYVRQALDAHQSWI
jgi:Leucine-rich repeat (LRR) protein